MQYVTPADKSSFAGKIKRHNAIVVPFIKWSAICLKLIRLFSKPYSLIQPFKCQQCRCLISGFMGCQQTVKEIGDQCRQR